jgi:formylmethanofuran dehydrogenase subunit E
LRKIFGKADDFYRARILTLEEEVLPDFDWRDDILFHSPSGYGGGTRIKYCLQIVDLDSSKNHIFKKYASRKEAEQVLKKMKEDLKELTKMEFEKKYDLRLAEENSLSEAKKEEINTNEKNDKTNVPRNLS